MSAFGAFLLLFLFVGSSRGESPHDHDFNPKSSIPPQQPHIDDQLSNVDWKFLRHVPTILPQLPDVADEQRESDIQWKFLQHIPTMMPEQPDIDTQDFEKIVAKFDVKDIKLGYHDWTPYKPHWKKINWVVFGFSLLGFIVFWTVIIGCLVICKRATRRRTGGRPRETLLSISRITILVPRAARAGSRPTRTPEPAAALNKDMPPTYDEAVVNVPQTDPLL